MTFDDPEDDEDNDDAESDHFDSRPKNRDRYRCMGMSCVVSRECLVLTDWFLQAYSSPSPENSIAQGGGGRRQAKGMQRRPEHFVGEGSSTFVFCG